MKYIRFCRSSEKRFQMTFQTNVAQIAFDWVALRSNSRQPLTDFHEDNTTTTTVIKLMSTWISVTQMMSAMSRSVGLFVRHKYEAAFKGTISQTAKILWYFPNVPTATGVEEPAWSLVVDEERMRPRHWLGSMLTVSFSALTLTAG